MPTRTIVQILDSFDGQELDPDTRPITLTVDRRQWTLYLSEENAREFYGQIEQWTEAETESVAPAPSSAERVRRAVAGPAPTSSGTSAGSSDLAAVREWAREHGYEVADRGRVSAEVQEAYRAAQ